MLLEDSTPIDILKSDLSRVNSEINAIRGRIADYKYQLHLLKVRQMSLEDRIKEYKEE